MTYVEYLKTIVKSHGYPAMVEYFKVPKGTLKEYITGKKTIPKRIQNLIIISMSDNNSGGSNYDME